MGLCIWGKQVELVGCVGGGNLGTFLGGSKKFLPTVLGRGVGHEIEW